MKGSPDGGLKVVGANPTLHIMVEVVLISNGWAVVEPTKRGSLYCGSDGYWSRLPAAITPFKSKVVAQDMADSLNDKTSSKWE